MVLSNKAYDVLKWIALYLLPAIGTLYFTLSGLWGFPYGEEVVGTITAVDTFVAVIIGISSVNYKGDGTLLIDTSNPEKDIYRYDVSTPLEELPQRKKIVLTVDGNADLSGGKDDSA